MSHFNMGGGEGVYLLSMSCYMAPEWRVSSDTYLLRSVCFFVAISDES